MHWGWRLLWGVVGGGLIATVLVAAEVGLPPPLLIGISVGGGILVAIFGPMILELLTLIP